MDVWWLLGEKQKSPDPDPKRNPETAVRSLHMVPALTDSRIAGVSQCWIFAAAQNGISEVIADLAPLTAAAPNTANLAATIQAPM